MEMTVGLKYSLTNIAESLTPVSFFLLFVILLLSPFKKIFFKKFIEHCICE